MVTSITMNGDHQTAPSVQKKVNGLGLKKQYSSSASRDRSGLSDNAFAVTSLRNLLFDICNQYGGGHGGSAVGMAAIGVALWKYTMRYNPSNPDWFDRDRFVLSNGELPSRDQN